MNTRTHVRLARFAAIFALLALCSVPVSDALGQPAPGGQASSARDPKRAEKLFFEAKALLTKEEWAAAEAKLQEAWGLNPTYDVAVNLGQTQYRMKKYREAAKNLSFAARNFPIIGARETRDRAEGRLKEVRGLLVTVRVDVSVKGAQVTVNGEVVGESPLEGEVFADPGPVIVEARLAGYRDARQVIDGKKGASEVVTLKLVADAPPPPLAASASPSASGKPPLPPVPEAERPLWPAAIGGGAALVLLTVGVVATVAANGAASDAEALQATIDASGARCGLGASAGACDDLASAASSQGSFRDVAVVTFIGSGVAAVAGSGLLTWALMGPDSGDKAAVRATPNVGPQGAGLLLGGSF